MRNHPATWISIGVFATPLVTGYGMKDWGENLAWNPDSRLKGPVHQIVISTCPSPGVDSRITVCA